VLAVMNAVEILLMMVIVTIIMTMAVVRVRVYLKKKFLGFYMPIDCYDYEYWFSVSKLPRHSPCI
jgi:hypothetical protein